MLYKLIVLLPLVGTVSAGLFGRQLGHRGSEILTSSLLVLSAILSIIAFIDVGYLHNVPEHAITIMRWFDVGAFEADWAIRVDTLTVVMLVVVTGVSSLVHIYSIGYMSHDPNRSLFFSYLSLFTFAMLTLVTADNFLQLFFGWEGVGLTSYLLIGFWYKKPSACAAAIKAFIVNRVGDFGFALGIMGIFFLFQSVQFDEVFRRAPEFSNHYMYFLGHEVHALSLICILLFIGAMGKSAQFILHTWLPDAMEGPTPVSALIHAATMVTAGVFLVCRCSYLFEFAPAALMMVTIVGAVTAFFAASVGLVQNDIKRVIAYSTCSQLGYMFVGAGLGAYETAMFHLFTHAFFKALLFLCAGSVIHALHDEQDMRRMGGLFKKIPLTGTMMIVGTLAITGVGIPHTHFGFSGFVSKDAIIEVAFASKVPYAGFAFWMTVIAAAMTSYYSWRLIFMTFFGETRAPKDHFDHAHESPSVMLVPLAILATGAAVAGTAFQPQFLGHERGAFWSMPVAVHGTAEAGAQAGAPTSAGEEADHAAPAEATQAPRVEETPGFEVVPGAEVVPGPLGPGKLASIYSRTKDSVLEAAHHIEVGWVFLAPFVAMVIGLVWSYFWFIVYPQVPVRIAENNGLLYRFLYNKWYFDEIYDYLFVKPAMRIGRFFWKRGDGWLIDGFGPDGVAASVIAATKRVVKLQSGYVYHYAFAMLIGIALLVSFYYGRDMGLF